MGDETSIRSAGSSDLPGHSGGGSGESTPLQSRAHFLKNWDWLSVTEINRGLCARGRAQWGLGKETHQAVAEEWEKVRQQELALGETFEFLKSCHRRAPFLFFNGNTFAEIGRALANALFYELPTLRRKEVASAVAHFITGVMDWESMAAMIRSMARRATLTKGSRVKSLRGSLKRTILRTMEDGRVVWKPDGASRELIALPESLLPDD